MGNTHHHHVKTEQEIKAEIQEKEAKAKVAERASVTAAAVAAKDAETRAAVAAKEADARAAAAKKDADAKAVVAEKEAEAKRLMAAVAEKEADAKAALALKEAEARAAVALKEAEAAAAVAVKEAETAAAVAVQQAEANRLLAEARLTEAEAKDKEAKQVMALRDVQIGEVRKLEEKEKFTDEIKQRAEEVFEEMRGQTPDGAVAFKEMQHGCVLSYTDLEDLGQINSHVESIFSGLPPQAKKEMVETGEKLIAVIQGCPKTDGVMDTRKKQESYVITGKGTMKDMQYTSQVSICFKITRITKEMAEKHGGAMSTWFEGLDDKTVVGVAYKMALLKSEPLAGSMQADELEELRALGLA